MSRYIKSRKHAVSRRAPTSLTATLFTGLALGAALPADAQSVGPAAADPEQRKTTTLDKVEVQGERERQYSGEVSSPKFTQPLVDTTQTVNVIGADLFTEQGASTLTDVLRNSPGVGTFCRPVLDRLPRGGELVVIDTNPLFIDFLKHEIRDSRFHPVLGSAEDVEEIVRSLGHEHADYVLSGLPFSTLPEGVGPAIAAATHRVIRPGGAFLTYQFSTTARDLTARHFPRVDTGMTWLNVPPCLLAWGWKA